MTQDAVICALRQAVVCHEEQVEVEFSNGTRVVGAILFNESKGVGKVINVAEEISVDFKIEQISAVTV
jgi:hypothetical protein